MKQRLVYIVSHILLLIFTLGVVEPLFASLKADSSFEKVADSRTNSEKEAAEMENSTKDKELSTNLFYVETETFFIAEIRYANSHPASCASSHSGFSSLPDLPPELI